MTFPAPRPGLVVRYGFLWRHEYEAGADEASKDRPCAVVVATSSGHTGDIRVVVSPITLAYRLAIPSISLEEQPAASICYHGYGNALCRGIPHRLIDCRTKMPQDWA